jgi:hypothetical protein
LGPTKIEPVFEAFYLARDLILRHIKKEAYPMMKHDGFKSLSLVIVSGFMLGACSPLAPSVSKLSNTAGQKSTPTDGAGPTTNISVGSGAFSSKVGSGASILQQTEILTRSQYRREWNLVHDIKPSMDLDEDKVAEFRESGNIVFESNDERVRRHEEIYSTGRIKILFATNLDVATIISLGLDETQALMKWQDNRWELSLLSPSTGDPAKDTNMMNQAKAALHEHLTGISIEFQAD